MISIFVLSPIVNNDPSLSPQLCVTKDKANVLFFFLDQLLIVCRHRVGDLFINNSRLVLPKGDEQTFLFEK